MEDDAGAGEELLGDELVGGFIGGGRNGGAEEAPAADGLEGDAAAGGWGDHLAEGGEGIAGGDAVGDGVGKPHFHVCGDECGGFLEVLGEHCALSEEGLLDVAS